MLVPASESDCIALLRNLRDQSFKLQPIQMGGSLIKQINAVSVKLQSLATKLQDLVKRGKNKNRHYAEVITQAV